MDNKNIKDSKPTYTKLQNLSEEEYIKYVQMKIDRAEKSGLAEKQTKEELLAEIKKRLGIQ